MESAWCRAGLNTLPVYCELYEVSNLIWPSVVAEMAECEIVILASFRCKLYCHVRLGFTFCMCRVVISILCWHFIHISLTVLIINNNKNNIRTITFIDDLYCVGWGVKLYSLTRAVIYGRHVRVHMGHLRWSVPGTSLPLIGQAANLSVESAVVFLLSHKSDSHFTIPQWASVDCWGCFFLKNFGKFWITDWQNESLNVNDKQILLCTNLLNGIYL